MKCPEFKNYHIAVVGDVMLDQYWHGDTSRISPEAPVPVVKIESSEERVGGAANVAVNVSALGAKATLIAAVGLDDAAERLKAMLEHKKVDCDFIQSKKIDTTTKLRVLGRHQQLLRLDFEKHYPWPSENILNKLERHFLTADAVIMSDYAKGMLANPQDIIQFAKSHHKKIIVDPKSADLSVYKNATILTPNLKEFEATVGICTNVQDIIEKGNNLLSQLGLEALLVTRGADGMVLLQKGHPEALTIPAQAREVYDITGAGDTVIAVLTATLVATQDYALGAKLANFAAGISVGKLGTATITREDLIETLETKASLYHANSLYSVEKMQKTFQRLRQDNQTIVMTNGCFDILHPGHLHYLEEARELGDCLVVAINDDHSISRLKGSDRPINSLEDRAKALLALKSVDYVISFSEDTPHNLYQKLVPDILVKGGDYQVHNIVGAKEVIEHGGEVKVLSFVGGYSTSNLIKRIIKANQKEKSQEVGEVL